MLKRLALNRIRAYEEAHVEFSPGMNVFWGPNGNGKTTILEAAYLLGTARSFRTADLSEMIRTGAPSGSVEAEIGDPEQNVRIELEPGRRTLFRNGRKVAGVVRFAQELTLVALAPEHQRIVTGSGEERRRYLDYTLFTLDPSYLDTARRFARALRQKQALLRAALPRSVYEDRAAPWDERLAELGEELRFRRRKLAKRLEPGVRDAYRRLSQDGRGIDLTYRAPEVSLAEEIAARRTVEHAAGRALCGPQRDDLEILFDGRPAAAVASQGEKASLLLSLKLAELEILEHARGERAVLILDDIGVTLDRERRNRLFALVTESPHQALVSTPEEEISEAARHAGGLVLSRFEGRGPAGNSIAQWGTA